MTSGDMKENKSESTYEKTLRLEQECEDARTVCVGELLAQRQEIDEKLKRLKYQPISKKLPVGEKTTKIKSKDAKAKYNWDLTCKVCNMVGHDGRTHRVQTKVEGHPRAFTTEELAQSGLNANN